MRLYIGICILVVLTAGTASAQVSTGITANSSMGGGPFDQINLGNLNAHFAIPVLHKAGRGVPFNFDIIYDSSVWYPVSVSGTTTWQPSNTWGWSSTFAPIMGSLIETTTVTRSHSTFCFIAQYSTAYSYYDPRGRVHLFPGETTYVVTTGDVNCRVVGTTYGANLTVAATDGSGYQLFAPSNPSGTATVTNLAGQVVGFAGGTNSSPFQDTNGNFVSYTSRTGQFFDTLSGSTPVLTEGGGGSPSSPTTYTYTAPSGATADYTVNYTQYTVATAFGLSGINEYGPVSVALASSIQLPDGTEYTFGYEKTPGSCSPLAGTDPTNCVTGRMAMLTLPTGGTIDYCYSGPSCPGNSGGPAGTGIFADGSTASITRTLSPGGTWTYTRSLVTGTPGPGSTWTTTVNDPSSPHNTSVSSFAEDATITNGTTTVATYDMYETERQVYQGSPSPSNLLETIITCYNAHYSGCAGATASSPISQTDAYTVLPNGLTRLSEIQFNGSPSVPGLESKDSEYTFGVAQGSAPGTTDLVEQTQITYASMGNNILGDPANLVVSDWSSGSAQTLSSTTYSYDQTSVITTSGTPQHNAISGSRGNLTTLATQANSSTTLYQTFSYYDTGNLNTATGLSTSASSPGPSTTYNYASGSSCGNSFVTSVTEPLGLSRSMTWNCTGGVETLTTDENSQPITTNYSDAFFWRPANVYDQENNETTITYSGQTATESTLLFNGGNSVSDTRSTVDGFGRPILRQQLQGPSSASYNTTETDYNLVGLPDRSTMPFNAAAGGTSSSAPSTNTTYDALGRPWTVSDADGGSVSYVYTNNDVLITVSGGQNFKKQLEYDGLGRLASVCEISSTLSGVGTCGQSNPQSGYWTKYTYDALGRLLTVTQNAQAASGHQTRSYSYDLLARLLSESNPESGRTSYTYDIACTTTLASPGDLTRMVDNAGNNTCFGYDALHRLVGEGWNNVCRFFNYDNSVTPPSGVTVANTKTRLVEAYSNNCTATTYADEWFSYSPRGELTDVYESTPHSGGYLHATNSYWPSGIIETEGLYNASGSQYIPTIYYGASNNSGVGLDGMGRYTQVTAGSTPNPVTNVTYSVSSTSNPLGALTGVTYGSSDNDSFSYDPNTGRQKSYVFAVNGSTDAGALTWNTNGTLGGLGITDGIAGTGDSQTCSYSYDDLARASGVNCGTVWQQAFTYDAFGNLDKSGNSSFAATYSPTTNEFSLSGTSVRYDSDGNLLTDNLNTYTWDPNWGNMTSVSTGAATITATYDALGRVVEQDSGSSYSEVLWSPIGKAAVLNGATLEKAFVGLPGGGTAVYTSSGLTYYRHSDWLESSRLASTQGRLIYSSTAYAPFGEQYASTGTADASFTDQNADTASSLYDFQFRRLSPSQGRWISPDPYGITAVDPANPQTWNRYAYVGNSPLARIDSLGLDFEDDGSDNPCDSDSTTCFTCDPSDSGCFNSEDGDDQSGFPSDSDPVQSPDPWDQTGSSVLFEINAFDAFPVNIGTIDLGLGGDNPLPLVSGPSLAGLRFVARCEGFVPNAYPDSRGNCTIGYGHLLHKGPCTAAESATSTTEPAALAQFAKDASSATDALNSALSVPLNQSQYDAMFSLTFNMGIGNLQKHTVWGDVNSGNFDSVPSDIQSLSAGGKGIAYRRAHEADIFSNGVYATACYSHR